MSQLTAVVFVRGNGSDWFFLPLYIAVGVGAIVARYGRFFVQWWDGLRVGDWPRSSAVVDVVSVVEEKEQRDGVEYIVGYLATLTYFYRNPELQVGEYSKMFRDEREATSWVAAYKGSQVMVHVDPKDPARSVLRKQDL